MAKRTLRPHHSDEVRSKIQASQLVNRLQNHANGKLDLSATQIRAAEILLKKSIPDLTATELSGPGGLPIEIEASERPKLTREEWLAAHGMGIAARQSD